jgi:hypothetical protein
MGSGLLQIQQFSMTHHSKLCKHVDVMSDWIDGIIIAGHGVAGGRAQDSRFPGGTIRLQKPCFLAQGIDLSRYYDGTLNVDLAPKVPAPPKHIIFQGLIKWRDDVEELFTLSPLEVDADGRRYSRLWYHPHPETKPEHFQPETVVELLLPWIAGLAVGRAIKLRFA